jgi:hypothetical protein
MKLRQGASLVELLLVLSSCTVILTMSAGLIHRMLHVQSRTRAFVDGERSALRLASQFRRDVHEATSAVADADQLNAGELLRLIEPAEQTVVYLGQPGAIVRLLTEGGRSVAREEYRFAGEFRPEIRRETPGLIVLTLASLPKQTVPLEGVPRKSTEALPVSLQIAAKSRQEGAP